MLNSALVQNAKNKYIFETGKGEVSRRARSQMEFLTYAAGMLGMQDCLIWERGRETKVERTDRKVGMKCFYIKIDLYDMRTL